MLIRAWLLGVMALAPLAAQFDSLSARFDYLVAPGNGADVYFRITRPLKGSGQPQQGRIFKIGSTPLVLVAAVTNTGLPQPCTTPVCSTSQTPPAERVA